jgi:hypothetical protein
MNKTAKEMFEELGFEWHNETTNLLEYIAYPNGTAATCNYATIIIQFDKINKTYLIEKISELKGLGVMEINCKLHKAITKKLEELGWE